MNAQADTLSYFANKFKDVEIPQREDHLHPKVEYEGDFENWEFIIPEFVTVESVYFFMLD